MEDFTAFLSGNVGIYERVAMPLEESLISQLGQVYASVLRVWCTAARTQGPEQKNDLSAYHVIKGCHIIYHSPPLNSGP